MKKTLLPWTAALGIAASLAFSSCAYDPYYSSAGGYYNSGSSYGDGYGDGYGYGGSNFSTSFFISTGDPRWGYDPYSYCYYDYRSRRYYDPYLYGYYPMGYRPYAVYGVPHPYGWRQGGGHCPPPRTVRDVTVANYRHRDSAYRNSNYSWAKQVRQRPYGGGQRIEGQHADRGTYSRPGSGSRQSSGRQTYYRPDEGARQSTDFTNSDRTTSRSRVFPQSDSRTQNYDRSRSRRGEDTGSRSSREHNSGRPSGYNTPVIRQPSQQPESVMTGSRPEGRPSGVKSHSRQSPERSLRGRGDSPQPDSRRESGSKRQREGAPSKEDSKALRSLGDG
jgi:hypothetical protein